MLADEFIAQPLHAKATRAAQIEDDGFHLDIDFARGRPQRSPALFEEPWVLRVPAFTAERAFLKVIALDLCNGTIIGRLDHRITRLREQELSRGTHRNGVRNDLALKI
jgi:hypothetical protein